MVCQLQARDKQPRYLLGIIRRRDKLQRSVDPQIQQLKHNRHSHHIRRRDGIIFFQASNGNLQFPCNSKKFYIQQRTIRYQMGKETQITYMQARLVRLATKEWNLTIFAYPYVI